VPHLRTFPCRDTGARAFTRRMCFRLVLLFAGTSHSTMGRLCTKPQEVTSYSARRKHCRTARQPTSHSTGCRRLISVRVLIPCLQISFFFGSPNFNWPLGTILSWHIS